MSITRSSVSVGSLSSFRKCCCTNDRSSMSMASSMPWSNSSSCPASMSRKPSSTGMSPGASSCICRLWGRADDASRDSTGLMTYFLMLSTSAPVSSPCSTYTLAQRTVGLSPAVINWMHCWAESARWSNWPGRASTAKLRASRGRVNVWSYSSSWGSENTVSTARWKTSPLTPSAS